MKRRELLRNAAVGAGYMALAPVLAAQHGRGDKPNIIFIFVDDLGYADLGCYGNRDVRTPNVDRLANQGAKFMQFYVNSPVCSPSRVAVTIGQYPARWRIYSYIDSRKSNRARAMAEFLDPAAPSLARTLKQVGYATAHFGKWHMGGGRDVDDAPLPQAYGFDESLVSFEGLGDRVLYRGEGLSKASAKLGRGEIRWAEKHEGTQIYVDRAIDFIHRHKDTPFYMNLWPNDVHDAHKPKPEVLKHYAARSDNRYIRKFYAVLEQLDRQIGRLLDVISQEGLDRRTLIVFTSDNGPTDWPHYYREGLEPPGSVGPLRGRKWSLYEGGIRVPFIVRWPGNIPAGRVDRSSVLCGVDLFPTLCKLAGVGLPKGVGFDGEDMSRAFLGKPVARKKDIYWYYINKPKPGEDDFVAPRLAVRHGHFKLLVNEDGSDMQLYDLAVDLGEATNLAEAKPKVAETLRSKVLRWSRDLELPEATQTGPPK